MHDMKRYTVRVVELTDSEDRIDLTTRINLATQEGLANKTIKKLFGKKCFWFPNSEFGGSLHGEVLRSGMPTYSDDSCVVCRARITFWEGWQ